MCLCAKKFKLTYVPRSRAQNPPKRQGECYNSSVDSAAIWAKVLRGVSMPLPTCRARYDRSVPSPCPVSAYGRNQSPGNDASQGLGGNQFEVRWCGTHGRGGHHEYLEAIPLGRGLGQLLFCWTSAPICTESVRSGPATSPSDLLFPPCGSLSLAWNPRFQDLRKLHVYTDAFNQELGVC